LGYTIPAMSNPSKPSYDPATESGMNPQTSGATMTEEKAEALRVYQRQVGTFHTPPGCDDGVVARSFACNVDYIYEFALRNADELVTLTAYRHPGPPEGDGSSWATATTQGIPKLGSCVGELYRGPLDEAPLPGPDSSEA
jgi:hypothetical protein